MTIPKVSYPCTLLNTFLRKKICRVDCKLLCSLQRAGQMAQQLKEHLLLLQKIWFWLPALTSGRSQLTINLDSRDLISSSGLHRHPHTWSIHSHRQFLFVLDTHIQITKNYPRPPKYQTNKQKTKLGR